MATTGDVEPTLPGLVYVAEPPARYHVRPWAVVDSSLLCAMLFIETDAASAHATAQRYRLNAPHLLAYELANVAMNKVRRGGAEIDARDALAGFEAIDVALHDVDPMYAFDLAVRYRLSAYDAAYLVLADALRCPLLTLDRRLAEAAQLHLGRLE